LLDLVRGLAKAVCLQYSDKTMFLL